MNVAKMVPVRANLYRECGACRAKRGILERHLRQQQHDSRYVGCTVGATPARHRFNVWLIFRLACKLVMVFSAGPMSLLPTADLLALDISGLKRRLSMLRRYL